MVRTEQESDKRRRETADLLVPRDQQRACRMAQASAEKLEHTRSTEKSGLSATERAVGKYAGAAFAKRKRNRAVSPEHQIMRWE